MISPALIPSNEDKWLALDRTGCLEILIRADLTLELLPFIMMCVLERRERRQEQKVKERETSALLVYLDAYLMQQWSDESLNLCCVQIPLIHTKIQKMHVFL